jgi:predicted nuclease with TOPRIM domain
MVNNHIFEEQIRKLISETQDELNKIEEQLKSLEKQRSDLAEELHSYEQSLHGYLRRSGREVGQEESPDWDKLFKNRKTHKQRLITIAQHNGGELRLTPAVDILYNGQYIKSKSRANAYIQLYTIVMHMIDKGEMEKIGRARYRLTRQGELL